MLQTFKRRRCLSLSAISSCLGPRTALSQICAHTVSISASPLMTQHWYTPPDMLQSCLLTVENSCFLLMIPSQLKWKRARFACMHACNACPISLTTCVQGKAVLRKMFRLQFERVLGRHAPSSAADMETLFETCVVAYRDSLPAGG